ncbi:MAG: serine/threonine protein kinase [Planctomycetes bacterium]|nr:serine/threonine protein kinase [Planctomycetota bacterium]
MAAIPQTSDDLLRLIERSGLVTLEKINEALAGRQPPSSLLNFARWLVKAGLLTTFQADQLLQGKSRGFFLGKYRVLKHLGGGATAGVYLCEHQIMKNRVAVKVLSQELLDEDESVLRRFRREAQAAAALSHPNIVRTIDLDEDNGRHFLVMEYVEGVTLDEWMKKNPNTPARIFVRLILHAVKGLEHINDSGLIHRDLKPSNLLLDRQGTVKILDLGLARFTDERCDDLTQVQGAGIMGTVDFMSPEQAEGIADLDIRSDIYSLGATLYYLVTGGQIPFPSHSLGAKMIAIQMQEPRSIREIRPEIDPLLERIIAKMMAKTAAKRPQNPRELSTLLQAWLHRTNKKTVKQSPVPAATKPPMIPSVPAASLVEVRAPLHSSLPSASTTTKVKKPSRHKLFVWSLRAAALLILVGGLLVLRPWLTGQRAVANTPAANATK